MLLGKPRVLLGEVLQQAPSVLHSCSIPVEGREVFTARPKLKFQVGRLGTELSPHFLCNLIWQQAYSPRHRQKEMRSLESGYRVGVRTRIDQF